MNDKVKINSEKDMLDATIKDMKRMMETDKEETKKRKGIVFFGAPSVLQ